MSVVSLLGVKVLNNPAPFDSKYQFEITFECLENLKNGRPLHWTDQRQAHQAQIWSGRSPTSALLRRKLALAHAFLFSSSNPHITRSEHDQELDSLLVGPVPVGVNKFIFEADSPNLKRIPDSEILGVTVILLSCSYDDREFVRVGYYVNNEYDSEEMNAEPPSKVDIKRVRRNVLAEKPRVTRFAIKWCVEAQLLHYCSCTDAAKGIRTTLPLPNILQNSPKQTWVLTMVSTMALKKSSWKRVSKPS